MSRPSLDDNAAFLERLRQRVTMRGGADAAEAWLHLTTEDISHLETIAERLARMAPHEEAIRRIVVGR